MEVAADSNVDTSGFNVLEIEREVEAVTDSKESFSLLGLTETSLSLLVGFLKMSLELEPSLGIIEFAFTVLT